jgi:hypothetical protein
VLVTRKPPGKTQLVRGHRSRSWRPSRKGRFRSCRVCETHRCEALSVGFTHPTTFQPGFGTDSQTKTPRGRFRDPEALDDRTEFSRPSCRIDRVRAVRSRDATRPGTRDARPFRRPGRTTSWYGHTNRMTSYSHRPPSRRALRRKCKCHSSGVGNTAEPSAWRSEARSVRHQSWNPAITPPPSSPSHGWP